MRPIKEVWSISEVQFVLKAQSALPERSTSPPADTHATDVLARYPVYGVLLYTPTEGLDGRLHEYVIRTWDHLNALSEDNLLLLAVENIRKGCDIEKFELGDVYKIARYLGVQKKDFPAIVLFTEPENRRKTLTLRLKGVLPATDKITDEEMTDFFRSIASVVDSCADKPANTRLKCLQEGLRKEWPQESRWVERATQAGDWVEEYTVQAATIAKALATLWPLFSKVLEQVSPLL